MSAINVNPTEKYIKNYLFVDLVIHKTKLKHQRKYNIIYSINIACLATFNKLVIFSYLYVVNVDFLNLQDSK